MLNKKLTLKGSTLKEWFINSHHKQIHTFKRGKRVILNSLEEVKDDKVYLVAMDSSYYFEIEEILFVDSYSQIKELLSL